MTPDAPVRVVYVAGSSHSGSTLLALLADEHPLVASVGEMHVKPSIRREGRARDQRCSCGETVATCPFWTAVFARVGAQGLQLSVERWENDFRFESRWLDRLLTRDTGSSTLRMLRRSAGRFVPPYANRLRRITRLNAAIMRAVLQEAGAQVFVDTTKLTVRLAHLRESPEFDVRLVWLVRDVRGVAYSAARRGLNPRAAARVWLNDQTAISQVADAMPPDRRLVLRYEDLCRRPATVLAELWRFCGVPDVGTPLQPNPSMHHVLGNRMRSRGPQPLSCDEKWRAGLSGADQRAILKMTAQMSHRFDYR